MTTSNRTRRLALFCLFVAVLLASSACSASKAARYDQGAAGSTGAVAERADDASPLDGRKLKRDASMTVEVDDEDDIEPTIERAQEVAKTFEGYVARRSGEFVHMMVPTDKLEGVLDRLSTLGEVTAREVYVVDVTSQYVDLEIRIDNLEQTRQRLQQLLAQSHKVSDVLEVEKELSRVTIELERLKGRMRTMRRQTSYASVNFQVEEEVSPGPLGWVVYGGYRAVKWLFVWD